MDNRPLTDNALPKKERLSGKTDIERLLSDGRYGYSPGLKFCYAPGSGREFNRIMVAVPKKLFRRAVKRNLLKRRIRESYRVQKRLLPDNRGIDILFMYNSKEILDYETIKGSVAAALMSISSNLADA
jgi:hypothetical protein